MPRLRHRLSLRVVTLTITLAIMTAIVGGAGIFTLEEFQEDYGKVKDHNFEMLLNMTKLKVQSNEVLTATADMFLAEQLEERIPSAVYTNTKSENLPKALQESTYHYIESDTIQYKSTISALSLNLLNNLDRSNEQSKSVDWSAWKPAAFLGAVLTSIWMGIFFWQNNLLQKQSNQYKTQIEQVYKNIFPNGRIVDAPVQMSSALKKLKTNTGQIIESPLPLIADIGPLLKEYKDMVLSELRYQENQLSMTIESPNLTRLESFKRDAANKRKLKVVIKDSTTTANKVKATILISPLPNASADTANTKDETS